MDRIQREFEAFHAANPRVYAEIVSITRQYSARGILVGIAHVWEIMRWTLWIETRSPDPLKLNNNHRSRYARLVRETEPDLANAFRIRALKSRSQAGEESSAYSRSRDYPPVPPS